MLAKTGNTAKTVSLDVMPPVNTGGWSRGHKVPGRLDERLNVDQRTVAERHGRTQRRTAGES